MGFRDTMRREGKLLKQLIGLFSLPTVATVSGVALLVPGLAMIYTPLAFIVPGMALSSLGIWLAWPRRAN